MDKPITKRVPGHGVELQVYEWPGAEPALLFAHATGFHARCWDAVIELLPGRRAVAVDMRGHGLSDKPEPPYSWDLFGLDMVALIDALELECAIGIGHSKGGHAVTAAAAARPGAFAGLLLVDPVITAARAEPLPESVGDHYASRRRDRWSSPDEMYERFSSREPFSLWQPRVLRDYCEYGLIPAADGDGFVLACPPAIEAAVYAGAGRSSLVDVLPKVDIPVRVLRAKERVEGGQMDMTASPTDPQLASRLPNATDYPLPHLTHFIPMQEPELVARHIEEMLAEGTGRELPPLE